MANVLNDLVKTHGVDTETKVKHLYTDVEIVDRSKMVLGGYVSTRTPDLAGDIVEPSGFKPHIDKYKANPVYCWMHDQYQPIGKVTNVRLDDYGLYLEDIKLTKYPFVENFIFPLVEDGVLKQQSIGFLALQGKSTQEGYFRITESYLLESSLVTVACNPTAVLDYVKAIDVSLFNERDEFVLSTVRELQKAYDEGKIRLVNDMSKQFAISDNPLAPDFSDVKVTHEVNKFESSDDTIYLAESDTRKCKLFPVAVKNEDGYAYKWELVATGLAKLLGAKGAPLYTEQEKQKMLIVFRDIYATLEKAFPALKYKEDGVTVDFEKSSYHKVKWFNGEESIVAETVLNEELKSVAQFLEKKPALSDESLGYLKNIYASISIYASSYGEDLSELQSILDAVSAVVNAQAEDDEEEYGETLESAYELSAEELEALAKANELLKETASFIKGESQ